MIHICNWKGMTRMTLESRLKDLILSRYGTIKDFAPKCGLPYSTIDTILRRGLNKASVSSVIAMCQALGISADELAKGNIAPAESVSVTHLTDICAVLDAARENIDFHLDMTLDGVNLTRSELETLIDALDAAVTIIRKRRSRT